MQISTYLSFNGQCEEAFRFYERSLGAKLNFMMTYAQSPMAAQTPANWQGKIMHATLSIDGQTIMGSDPTPDHYKQSSGFAIALNIKDPSEAERIFKNLSESGNVQMPIQETFWARRFGMVADRFGTPWMVNCEKPMDQQG